MKAVVLPMDERPPNYSVVQKIGKMLGLEIRLPGRELLGRYMRPGKCEELGLWLIEESGDAFVISVDMLLFGGLIASRAGDASELEALKRLELIRELRERNPSSRILLSSIVRRASISVSSAGSRELWERLNRYLRAIGNGQDSEARSIESTFPRGFLESYYRLRNRNHIVNRACVELVKEKVADLLVLAQEDTFPNGPQKRELEALEKLSLESGVAESVFIHNGADEVIQELLTFTSADRQPLSVDLIYDSPETEKKVMDFEDRRFGENVKSHMRLVGLTVSEESQTSIFIAGSDIEKALEKLKDLSKKKKRIFILDVFRANGSNRQFVEAFLNMGLENIWGYSAWNTASNSLGTLLAVVVAACRSTNSSGEIGSFYLSRLLDDHLYQGVLRDELEKRIRDVGGDEYRVSESGRLFEEFRDDLFIPRAVELIERYFYGRRHDVFGGVVKKGSISIADFFLPWDRTFECDLELIEEGRECRR